MNEHLIDAAPKEISCRVTRTLVLYVRQKNDGRLGHLLDGLPVTEDYLLDENNWVSHELLQVLYGRMVDILGDEQAVYNMTIASEPRKVLGILDSIVRLLGSPRIIYAQSPRYNRFIKSNGSVIIHEIGRNHAIIEDRYHDSRQKTRYDCDCARGVFVNIPRMFDLPVAEIEEIQCQVAPDAYGKRHWPDSPPQGAAGCVYRVRWKPRRGSLLRRLFRRRDVHAKAIDDLLQANRMIQAKYEEVRQLATALAESNQKLAESERNYRLLAENASDIIWMLDLETLSFSYVSPSVEKVRGYTPEEAAALSIEETLSPESMAEITALLDHELRRDGHAGVAPQRYRCIEVAHSIKGGGYAWAEATVSFVRDGNGNPIAVMGVSRDITARKKAEGELRKREKRYRTIVENISDLICVHDLEGRVIETNLHFKQDIATDRKELVGRSLLDFFGAGFRDDLDQYLQRIRSDGQSEGLFSFRTTDGRKHVIEYRSIMVDGPGGAPLIHSFARDITDRWIAEKALESSEKRYRLLFENAGDAIFIIDAANGHQGRIVDANRAAAIMHGYPQADLKALTIRDIDDGQIASRMDDMAAGKWIKAEIDHRRKDGPPFPVEVSAGMIRIGQGDYILAFYRDVTLRRRLELKLRRSEKMEAIGTLAGGVAHDLNNILSGIVSYPDLLLMDVAKDSPLHKPLTTIKKTGEKAAAIVSDLLTLARRGVPDEETVNLNVLVAGFLESPEFKKTQSLHPGVTVDVRLDPSLAPIQGSAVQLSQALMNMVVNAAEAIGEAGAVSISTENVPQARIARHPHRTSASPHVALTISDTGTGIPPDAVDRIFEPFYSRKKMGKSGTGLGMAVVWNVVQDHGGFIDVDSEVNQGTMFSLYFPVTEDAPVTTAADPPALHYSGNGESILVVEDMDWQREMLEEVLKRLNYTPASVPSGEAAVAYLGDRRVDLVILDMLMEPGMDGLETYKQILAIHPGQKAIVVSGFSEKDRGEEMLALGACAYIRKPYNIDDLAAALSHALKDG